VHVDLQPLPGREKAQAERFAQLQREIEDSRQQAQAQALANVKLAEAIQAAEELLQMLNAEQAKYADLDDVGRPRAPCKNL
jgi:uncharacterized membrane protein YqiK